MSIAFKNFSPSEVIVVSGRHPVLTFGAVIGIAIFLVIRYLQSPWRKLPPGPRGLPFIGSALELRGHIWLTFVKWKKEFGTIRDSASQRTLPVLMFVFR